MYSLIVPVYRNAANMPALLERVRDLHAALEAPLEAVFVIDGSPDDSHRVLAEGLAEVPYQARLLLLSRNFGSFAAIRAGLAAASGPYYAVMAADLQEPPELITEFFRLLAADAADITLGTRTGRGDPLASRTASRLFWGAYRRLVQRDLPAGGVDVFGCNQRVCDHLLRLEESNTSLVGLLFWLGFRRSSVEYQRLSRQHGTSAWSYRRKLTYLLDSIFGFTDLPIRALILLGALGLITSTLLATVVLVVRLTVGFDVPGYAMTVLVITFFAGLNSLGLGVVGSYVWRAFENTKGRPGFVVMEQQTFGGDSGD